ncbi:hypothetical protein RRG08_021806 [Elysia crispata]|uniref:Uncharacterized protein n=1 Tax=Elysia crispata TaxID=231223 RepID=A0AAE0ZZ89_9GAST|nr:hypothetical protein RRG08_021806 [Elysia crispata]
MYDEDLVSVPSRIFMASGSLKYHARTLRALKHSRCGLVRAESWARTISTPTCNMTNGIPLMERHSVPTRISPDLFFPLTA